MRSLYDRMTDWEFSPHAMRRMHFWAAVLFAVLIVPSVTWWKDSVPYLVAISVWANLAGHLSSWQAARVEERQEATQEDQAALLDEQRGGGKDEADG